MTSPEPDFVVCQECETPCYNFEWDLRRDCLVHAFCELCGNDAVEGFRLPRDEET
jgi:hypothetical protein